MIDELHAHSTRAVLQAMTAAAPTHDRSVLPTSARQDTVVCIATGASLTPDDVNYVRDKATVIVVNDAHRLAPWADILYSGDRYWWMHYKGVPEFRGYKATIEYSPGRKHLQLLKYVPHMIFHRLTGHTGVETARDGLRTCGANSGGQALNLAVHLHPTRIILLGYDLGATQGKRHFFGDHPRPLSNSHDYPRWRQAFATMANPLADLGISVLNCSRVTSLNGFLCVPLRGIL